MFKSKSSVLCIVIFLLLTHHHEVKCQVEQDFDFYDFFNDTNFVTNNTYPSLYELPDICYTEPLLTVPLFPDVYSSILDLNLLLNTVSCISGSCMTFNFSVVIENNGTRYYGGMSLQSCLTLDECRTISCAQARNTSGFRNMSMRYNFVEIGDDCARLCCDTNRICDSTNQTTTIVPTPNLTNSSSALSCGHEGTLPFPVTRITSPNYPDAYPNFARCQWIIRTKTPGSKIRISFVAFNTEPSHDSLRVEENGTEVRLWSGSNTPSPHTSRTNEVTLIFSSDGVIKASGFEATLEEIPSLLQVTFPTYEESSFIVPTTLSSQETTSALVDLAPTTIPYRNATSEIQASTVSPRIDTTEQPPIQKPTSSFVPQSSTSNTSFMSHFKTTTLPATTTTEVVGSTIVTQSSTESTVMKTTAQTDQSSSPTPTNQGLTTSPGGGAQVNVLNLFTILMMIMIAMYLQR